MKLLSIFSTMYFVTQIMTIPPNDGLEMTDQAYSDLKYSGARNRTTKAAIPKFGDTRTIEAICYEERCGSSTNYCSPEFSSC